METKSSDEISMRERIENSPLRKFLEPVEAKKENAVESDGRGTRKGSDSFGIG